MCKRIAITGASGHLGTALIEPSLNKGYSVNAQYRSSAPPISDGQLNWMQGSITDIDFLKELFLNCDVVIHCAGLISLNKSDKCQVFDTNINGTKAVIEALRLYKNTRLIYVSSTSAIKDISQKTIFDENSPIRTSKNHPYGYSKAKSEELVSEAINSQQLDAIIVRPSALIGPPDYRPSALGQAIIDLANGKIPALPSGGYDYTDVRDVADSIIKSIDDGKMGELYNLTGRYLSMNGLARLVSEITNQRIRPVIVPVPVMICLLPFVGFFSFFMNRKSVFTYQSLMTLKHGHKNMSHGKAKDALSHSPRPLKESIQDLIDWFGNENDDNDY